MPTAAARLNFKLERKLIFSRGVPTNRGFCFVTGQDAVTASAGMTRNVARERHDLGQSNLSWGGRGQWWQLTDDIDHLHIEEMVRSVEVRFGGRPLLPHGFCAKRQVIAADTLQRGKSAAFPRIDPRELLFPQLFQWELVQELWEPQSLTVFFRSAT